MLSRLLRLADDLRDAARRRQAPHELAVGRRAEDLAHRYLEQRGFQVVARNYRTRSGSGEVDLVAWEGPTLVLVEVKCRASDEYGTPERNVDPDKARRMARAGRDYARRAGVPWDRVRLDLVSVVLAERPAIRHRRNAFPAKTL